MPARAGGRDRAGGAGELNRRTGQRGAGLIDDGPRDAARLSERGCREKQHERRQSRHADHRSLRRLAVRHNDTLKFRPIRRSL